MLEHNDPFDPCDTYEPYRTVTSAEIHDLRNRFTVVKGISQLLVRQVRRADMPRGQLIERVGILLDEVLRLEVALNALGPIGERVPLAEPPGRTVYTDD